MATLNQDKILEFNDEDISSAWENAPQLINKNKNEFRMCYICKFHMIKTQFDNKTIGEFGWIVDLINLKSFSLEQTNFIAIHPYCIEFRSALNNTKKVKKIISTVWMFDERAYKEK